MLYLVNTYSPMTYKQKEKTANFLGLPSLLY